MALINPYMYLDIWTIQFLVAGSRVIYDTCMCVEVNFKVFLYDKTDIQ